MAAVSFTSACCLIGSYHLQQQALPSIIYEVPFRECGPTPRQSALGKDHGSDLPHTHGCFLSELVDHDLTIPGGTSGVSMPDRELSES